MSIKNIKLSIVLLLTLPFCTACLDSGPESMAAGTAYNGEFHDVDEIKFLYDISYTDKNNNRIVEQTIFDEIFQLIEQSNRFILVDMFLFNAFKGKEKKIYRPLSEELTQALIKHKARFPECEIIFISDPMNTVYDGLRSPHLERLKAAKISVTITKLNKLRDSNRIYSPLWRTLFASEKKQSSFLMLPNPFGDGRVPLSSYLNLLNFKANHRKVLIGANDESMTAIVSSANPHDGSSAHSNLGVRFSGRAVVDLLATEKAVLHLSDGPLIQFKPKPDKTLASTDLKIRVITESAIKQAILSAINSAHQGDAIDMAMFYLSDRDVMGALVAAKKRGVELRILLDPNKDAFGREKSGIPNRQVGHEINQQGAAVRWCHTQGEQCHSKLLMVRYKNKSTNIILGSANFTRRNLGGFNLETDVEIKGSSSHAQIKALEAYFNQRWVSSKERKTSVEYNIYQDDSLFKQWQYRFMEATGLSTF